MMRLHLLIGALFGLTVVPGSEMGATLENAIAPVLVESETKNVARVGNRMCFTWRFEKARAPKQLFFFWVATSPTNPDRTLIAPRLVPEGEEDTDDDEHPLRTGEARPPRSSGHARLCFSLPTYLGRDPATSIEGFAVYQGLLWRLPYRIGPVSG